jgi:hypothetical protein
MHGGIAKHKQRVPLCAANALPAGIRIRPPASIRHCKCFARILHNLDPADLSILRARASRYRGPRAIPTRGASCVARNNAAATLSSNGWY